MTTRPLAHDVTPIAMNVSQRVRLLLTSVSISDFCITQPGVVAYLRTIAPNSSPWSMRWTSAWANWPGDDHDRHGSPALIDAPC
jgi:hypothetical protein